MKNKFNNLRSILAVSAVILAHQGVAAFVNLDFELVDGQPITARAIGYGTATSGVDGWIDTASGSVGWNGVYLQNSLEFGAGSANFRHTDPVDAYQIDGSSKLSTGDKVVLTWYSNGAWEENGTSRIDLMAAPAGDSGFSELVSMVDMTSGISNQFWILNTLKYTVDAAHHDKYLAIRIGAGVKFGLVDNIKVTINATTAVDDTGYVTDINGGLIVVDGPNDLLVNDQIPNGEFVNVATGTTQNGGAYSVTAVGGFTYSANSTEGLDSFSYDLVSSQGGAVLSTGHVFITTGDAQHYYKFEETAGTVLKDEYGTASGAVTDPTWQVTGHEGSALAFNGTSTKVELGNAAALIGATDFTISAWIKTSAIPEGVIIQQRGFGDPGMDGQYQLKVTTAGKISFFTYKLSVYGLNFTSTLTVNDGNWHHVTVVREGTLGTIYIDGSASGTHTSPSIIPLKSLPVAIGYDQRDTNKFFTGSIDELKIYDAALTASQVHDIFTPVIDLEVVQVDNKLTWTVGEEIGVISYTVIDAETGAVIETVVADNSGTYTVTLPEGVSARLVVQDNFGSETYVPIDGNVVVKPYDLKVGWNLIALIGDNADLSKLKAATVGAIWAWNGSSYEKVSSTTATQALWVNAPFETQVDVTSDISDAEITLNPGWNLVGPVADSYVPEDAISVFGYVKNYVEETGVLARGVGYWIFAL